MPPTRSSNCAGGRLAIMAYSALDRLQSCCGEQKPWVVMPTPALARYRQVQEFHLILLDVAIPPEDRTSPDGPGPQHTTA
ncbi:SAV_915 family protein [Amycolatopsis lurida]